MIRQFSDVHANMFPELYDITKRNDKGKTSLMHTASIIVTNNCNLKCTYCYETNKNNECMSLETGKKFIDILLSTDKTKNNYVNPEMSPGIILEFFGGEPLLEITLVDQLAEYFIQRCIELNHPWLHHYRFSICSNGVLYFDKEVQRVLNKYKEVMSISITVDGNKKIHDTCRVFPNGEGSYDYAIAAVRDLMSKGYKINSKVTLSPFNIQYYYEAIVSLVEEGYDEIFSNCVFEKGWTNDHAKILYQQLKKISDYLLNINKPIELTMFDEALFCPMDEDNNENYCGGTGYMLSCSPNGKIYPCTRYSECSLNNSEPFSIGDINDGIGCNEQCNSRINCLCCISRRSQSTDECFNCPIANGCAWCSAYNYDVYGTPNKRATFICIMHKARALANVYYWNQYYKKHNINKHFEMYCPKEWALPIIGEDEYQMLYNLSKEEL